MRQVGCQLVGMTNVPEVFLAREAQICYATVGIATDYDCWMEDAVAPCHGGVDLRAAMPKRWRARASCSGSCCETPLPEAEPEIRTSLRLLGSDTGRGARRSAAGLAVGAAPLIAGGNPGAPISTLNLSSAKIRELEGGSFVNDYHEPVNCFYPPVSSTALALRDPWAMVPSLGNLDAYISAVNRIPMLTPEQETSLGRRWREAEDIQAAGQLVLSHLRLVVSISRQYLGYGLPQGDLIQEGNVGLMKAVKRFDPEQGVRLVSYAMHWIKAEIHEYILKNWRMVKVATTKAQRKLFFNLRSLKQNMKSDAIDAETHRSTLTQSEVDNVAEPAERQARRSAGDGNPAVGRRRGARAAERRRRGGVTARSPT